MIFNTLFIKEGIFFRILKIEDLLSYYFKRTGDLVN